MVVCALALLRLQLSQQTWAETHAGFVRQWRGLACIGACLAGGVAFNNLSLVTVTLSLNQIIRSFIPVVTALLCAALDRRLPDRLEMLSLLILTTGVAISMWEGTVQGKPLGMVLCMIGAVCTGLMSALSGKLLSESLGAVTLTLYTSPVSALTIAPFLFTREWRHLMAYYHARPGPLLLIAGVSSALAVAYNITHFRVIHRLSPVVTTVVGEIKIMLLLVASVYVLGEGQQFSPRFLAGCLMALGGFCMYSHIKLGARMRSQAVQALMPVSAKQQQQHAGKALPSKQSDFVTVFGLESSGTNKENFPLIKAAA
ncbi:hypothetical protein N2152v2_002547 [Parachlorella kessleri]